MKNLKQIIIASFLATTLIGCQVTIPPSQGQTNYSSTNATTLTILDAKALKGSEKTILKHKMPIIFEYENKFEEEFNYTFKDFENFINKIDYKIDTKIDEINYLIVPK